jgi:hypothetical protein
VLTRFGEVLTRFGDVLTRFGDYNDVPGIEY